MAELLDRLHTALADRYRHRARARRRRDGDGLPRAATSSTTAKSRSRCCGPSWRAVLGAERFLAEIKITARLDHPHILTLIDSGDADGFLYYVMPFVRGESLRDKLKREKQLGLDEAVAITRQVASALDYAHRHGVVHRDIKPENILLPEGEAMLADFGIALAVSEAGGNRLTETGLSLGTPQYMSPEQATGDRQLDARSDVYSLAAVLYEMLAGEPPVTGPDRAGDDRQAPDRAPDPASGGARRGARSGGRRRGQGARQDAGRPVRQRRRIRTCARSEDGNRADGRRVGAATPASAGAWRRRGGVALAAVAAGVLARGHGARREPGFALRDRSQLTFSGSVFVSAVSADGKQLAFVTHNCSTNGCSYAVEIQDVGGTATHRVIDGATAAYGLEWSPDRRNLIFVGTVERPLRILSSSRRSVVRRGISRPAPRCSGPVAIPCWSVRRSAAAIPFSR